MERSEPIIREDGAVEFRGAEKCEDLVGGRLLRQAFKLRRELDAPLGDDVELPVHERQRGDSVNG